MLSSNAIKEFIDNASPQNVLEDQEELSEDLELLFEILGFHHVSNPSTVDEEYRVVERTRRSDFSRIDVTTSSSCTTFFNMLNLLTGNAFSFIFMYQKNTNI